MYKLRLTAAVLKPSVVQTKQSPAKVAVACDALSIHGTLNSGMRNLIDCGMLDGVIGTHHIGSSTDQAQQAIADEVAPARPAGLDPKAVTWEDE
jgi:lactate dehydrogenase-like 2-hydroxyacid dehydrogenase